VFFLATQHHKKVTIVFIYKPTKSISPAMFALRKPRFHFKIRWKNKFLLGLLLQLRLISQAIPPSLPNPLLFFILHSPLRTYYQSWAFLATLPPLRPILKPLSPQTPSPHNPIARPLHNLKIIFQVLPSYLFPHHHLISLLPSHLLPPLSLINNPTSFIP
jgi:hypothetical protein